jgi:hypothetical protein
MIHENHVSKDNCASSIVYIKITDGGINRIENIAANVKHKKVKRKAFNT